MWMVDLCTVMVIACLICAGICVGTAILIGWEDPDGENLSEPDPPRPAAADDEQRREEARRKRELANFFNYNGDPMPSDGEKKFDKKA